MGWLGGNNKEDEKELKKTISADSKQILKKQKSDEKEKSKELATVKVDDDFVVESTLKL